MSKSIFIVSLDFELHWGGFEKWPIEKYSEYFLNTRNIIPEMLKLFTQFEVHATWATVGLLFHNSREIQVKFSPTLKPTYQSQELSAYSFIDRIGIGVSESDD